MSATASLRLFGPGAPQLHNDSLRLPQKQLAVLLLLILPHPPRRYSREHLSSAIWPDSSERSARHSLSQALYSLKKRFPGEDLFVADHLVVQRGGITTDVDLFRTAIKAKNWEDASRLYAGDLLPMVELPELPHVEDEINSIRITLSNQVQLALQELELDKRISPDRTSSSAGGTEPAPMPFVGRTAELEALHQLFNATADGEFTGIFLVGEAGIGKSYMGNRFLKRAVLQGGIIATAGGFAAERNVPFGVVDQWLRSPSIQKRLPDVRGEPWYKLLADSFPGAISGPGNFTSGRADVGDQLRILDSLKRLFQTIATANPLVLYVDDVHLADDASLGFVHYVSRSAPSSKVMFCGTVRTTGGQLPTAVHDWSNIHTLHVDPFQVAEIEELLRRQRDPSAVRAWDVEDLRRITGGNPLLLTTVLRAPGESPIPADVEKSLSDFFSIRLKGLSMEAVKLLAATSQTKAAAQLEELAAIAGMQDPVDVLEPLAEELERAGTAFYSSGRVEPRHTLIAEAAFAALPLAERRAIYGRAARAREQQEPLSPAVTAIQHDVAGDKLAAYEAALKAAEGSQHLFARREAEFFLKLAISNAPSPKSAADVRLQLSRLLCQLGRPQEASEVLAERYFDEAGAEAQRQGEAARLSVDLIQVQGSEVVLRARRLIPKLAKRLEEETVADLYSKLAGAAHDVGKSEVAVDAAEKAVIHAQLCNFAGPAMQAFIRASNVIGLYSGPDESLLRVREVLPLVREKPPHLAPCLIAEGTLQIACGNLPEAEESLTSALEVIERFALYDQLFPLRNNLGVCYMEQGRLDEAEQQLEAALQAGSELTAPSNAAIAADNIALLRYEQGRFEDAVQHSHNSLETGRVTSGRGFFTHNTIIGLSALELGRLAEAFEAKREIEEQFDRWDYWSNDMSYTETFLARVDVLQGHPERAIERLEKALEVYRGRDIFCSARLELELARLTSRANRPFPRERIRLLRDALNGSGAIPLIEQADGLLVRLSDS